MPAKSVNDPELLWKQLTAGWAESAPSTATVAPQLAPPPEGFLQGAARSAGQMGPYVAGGTAIAGLGALALGTAGLATPLSMLGVAGLSGAIPAALAPGTPEERMRRAAVYGGAGVVGGAAAPKLAGAAGRLVGRAAPHAPDVATPLARWAGEQAAYTGAFGIGAPVADAAIRKAQGEDVQAPRWEDLARDAPLRFAEQAGSDLLFRGAAHGAGAAARGVLGNESGALTLPFGYRAGSPQLGDKRRVAGTYVGMTPEVTTRGEWANLRRNLLRLSAQGEPGKFWYEQSAHDIVDMFGGDTQQAGKYVELLANFSPRTQVSGNELFATKAWGQFVASQPIRSGGFPNKMGAKAEQLLREGQTIGGPKVQPFFIGLLAQIDPTYAAKVFGEQKVKDAVAIDLWMDRVFGFNRGESETPSLQQGAWMRDEIRWMAGELTNLTGEEWKPHQVQAALWASARAMGPPGEGYSRAVTAGPLPNRFMPEPERIAALNKHFGDSIQRHLAQANWESAPGSLSPDGEFYASLSPQEKLAWHKAQVEGLLDENGRELVVNKLKLMSPSSGPEMGPGVWEGKVSPGARTMLRVVREGSKGEARLRVDPAARKLLDAHAAATGLALQQDAAGWLFPIHDPTIAKKHHNTVKVDIGRDLTDTEISALGDALTTAFPGDHFLAHTRGGVYVKNVSGGDNVRFHKAVQQAVDAGDWGDATPNRSTLYSDGEYIPASEYGDRTGRVGPDFQRWATEDLAPRLQTVRDEFRARSGRAPAAGVAADAPVHPMLKSGGVGPTFTPPSPQAFGVNERPVSAMEPDDWHTATLKAPKTRVSKTPVFVTGGHGKRGADAVEAVTKLPVVDRMAGSLDRFVRRLSTGPVSAPQHRGQSGRLGAINLDPEVFSHAYWTEPGVKAHGEFKMAWNPFASVMRAMELFGTDKTARQMASSRRFWELFAQSSAGRIALDAGRLSAAPFSGNAGREWSSSTSFKQGFGATPSSNEVTRTLGNLAGPTLRESERLTRILMAAPLKDRIALIDEAANLSFTQQRAGREAANRPALNVFDELIGAHGGALQQVTDVGESEIGDMRSYPGGRGKYKAPGLSYSYEEGQTIKQFGEPLGVALADMTDDLRVTIEAHLGPSAATETMKGGALASLPGFLGQNLTRAGGAQPHIFINPAIMPQIMEQIGMHLPMVEKVPYTIMVARGIWGTQVHEYVHNYVIGHSGQQGFSQPTSVAELDFSSKLADMFVAALPNFRKHSRSITRALLSKHEFDVMGYEGGGHAKHYKTLIESLRETAVKEGDLPFMGPTRRRAHQWPYPGPPNLNFSPETQVQRPVSQTPHERRF